jgi:hypothetical protein
MRRKTVAFDEVTKDGPIHLILGDDGRQANKPFLNTKPTDWAAVRDHTAYGWCSIEYLNDLIIWLKLYIQQDKIVTLCSNSATKEW